MIQDSHRLIAVGAAVAALLTITACGRGGDGDTGAGMMPGEPVAEPIAFFAGVDRRFPDSMTDKIADDGATAVTRTEDGWSLTVQGEPVEFAPGDLGAHPQLPSDNYYKALGNNDAAYLWAEEADSINADGSLVGSRLDYLDVLGFGVVTFVPGSNLFDFGDPDTISISASHSFVLHGTRTGEMPASGTASYEGQAGAHEWPSDDAVSTSQSARYRADFSMTATFGASDTMVAGEFSDIERRATRADDFVAIPGSIPFAISVDGNRFSTTIASIDKGPLAGYEDFGIRAAFFGPEAAEVGGVFDGENPTANTVLTGWFGGKKE